MDDIKIALSILLTAILLLTFAGNIRKGYMRFILNLLIVAGFSYFGFFFQDGRFSLYEMFVKDLHVESLFQNNKSQPTTEPVAAVNTPVTKKKASPQSAIKTSDNATIQKDSLPAPNEKTIVDTTSIKAPPESDFRSEREAIIKILRKLLKSSPQKYYCKGGEGPDCFCDVGLVSYAYEKAGLYNDMPMNLSEIKELSKKVEEPQPGDMVFYTYKTEMHVGIVLNEQTMAYMSDRKLSTINYRTSSNATLWLNRNQLEFRSFDKH